MRISDEAIEAAVPRITSWLDRSGLVLRNKEAAGLARYILEAAAPHLMAQAWEEGRQADDFSVSTGFERNPYRSAGARE